MKKTFIWLLITVFIASMALAGVGCKQAVKEEVTEEVVEEATEETLEEEVAEEEEVKEPVELVFWDMQWSQNEDFRPSVQALVDNFNNANPGINVLMQEMPWDNWEQVFLTAVAGGTAPDIATSAATLPAIFSEMGEAVDLNPILEEWKKDGFYDEFAPGAFDYFRNKELQAAMPWAVQYNATLYRKDVFDELGLTEPETFEEFLNVARTIKEKTDLIPFSYSSKHVHFMVQALIANETNIVDKDLNPALTGQKALEVFEFIYTLYSEGLVPEGIAAYDYNVSNKLYLTGKSAMVFVPQIDILQSAPDIMEKTSIMTPFAGPSGNKNGLGFLFPIMGYSQTGHDEEIKAFIKYFVENSLDLVKLTAVHPVTKTFSADPHFSENRLSKEMIEKIGPVVRTNSYPAENLLPGHGIADTNQIYQFMLQELNTGNNDFESLGEEANEIVIEAFER